MEPTKIEDVMLPVEMVELIHLKDRDGNPVVVRVEGLSELDIIEIVQVLPGRGDVPTDESTLESYGRIEEAGGLTLIERTTALASGSGEVRPAFYFGEPKPGALPGRLLRVADRVKLISAALRLSGFGEEAARTTFHVRDEAGRGGGAGTGADGSGEPADPVGSTS